MSNYIDRRRFLARAGLVVGGAVAGPSFLAACGGGPGADAPRDASIDDFCEAKGWMVAEGMDRFFESGLPSDDELVDLVHAWGDELARTGTPDNMSEDARVGFERFVERVGDLESGDVRDGSFNWQDENWENVEETSFANYVTNTCP